ncbi:MAG: bifunctional diaminohydroxyphosphoribosylaminopyrimidine deaminase/5-amino-6-(5-phosphoribosylamino)uracil reductase RibD [Bacteroidota bacterium]
MNIHEKYIKRCIEIGKNGLGTTAPNPMVGCIIVHDDTIISEGFTSPYGGPHAEVNAIAKVKDKSVLKSATIYVTLEPCSHYGKTPPCTDLIIKHEIPNIVIGCIDDNPQVAGKGVAKLKSLGRNVIVGVLEAECKYHHKRFFTFHNKKRPYIILKWAQTKNGFIAPAEKDKTEPVWITNTYAKQLVHKWRAEEQAILVGTNTVLEDNPSLTVRDWTGRNPKRVSLDKKFRIPKTASIYSDEAPNIVIADFKDGYFEKKENLPKGWNIYPPNSKLPDGWFIKIDWQDKGKIAKQICHALFEKDINSVIIEGGSKTLQTFIDENLWDEARVFTGNSIFENGTLAPKFNGHLVSDEQILKDNLSIYHND